MKKYLLLATALLFADTSIAQSNNKKEDISIQFGDTRPNATANGKPGATYTTKAEILRNPRFMTSMNIEVVEFTVSLMPKGKDFIGPFTVKGAELPENVKARIQETDSRTKVFFENIRVKTADGLIRSVNPFIMEYD